jgi:acetyltransferase-like isoleucine patch superfamily enzyme
VTIICEHYRVGKLTTGKHVLFARNVDIDYTGDLTIGNGVSLSEGVKILTHNHDFFGIYDESELIPYSNRAHATPLVIEDNVLIGAHAIIMPGVGRIGENAIISAGSIVTKEVPPNVVVSGNPAEVVRKLPKRARIYYRTEKH